MLSKKNLLSCVKHRREGESLSDWDLTRVTEQDPHSTYKHQMVSKFTFTVDYNCTHDIDAIDYVTEHAVHAIHDQIYSDLKSKLMKLRFQVNYGDRKGALTLVDELIESIE